MDIQITIQNGYGDLTLLGNDLVAVQGLENQPMLGMFGGDANYWANGLLLSEGNDMQFFSETEALLNKVPLNSAGRLDIEAAIKRDLQFLINNVPNTALNVQTKIVSDNRLEIKVNFGGVEFSLMWNPQNSGNGVISTTGSPLKLWNSPIALGESLTYGIGDIYMQFGSSTATIPAWVFYSSVNEAARVVAMNALAPSLGLTGSFSMVGTSFYYNQGYAENWSLSAAVRVLPYEMILTLTPIAPDAGTQDYAYRINKSIGAINVVDWGDSTDPVQYVPPSDIYIVNHIYANGLAAKMVNVFHDNTMIDTIVFDNTNSQTAYSITVVFGVIPICLKYFSNYQQLSTITNYPINNCALLETLLVDAAVTTKFIPEILTINSPHLGAIFLANNKLTSSVVDRLFINFVANTPLIVAGGIFHTQNQTPPAPPTTTSLAARNTLIANGWTIVTD